MSLKKIIPRPKGEYTKDFRQIVEGNHTQSLLITNLFLCSNFVHLTSLTLSYGTLYESVQSNTAECVIALQQLCLSEMYLHPRWVKSAFISLRQLKSLELNYCGSGNCSKGELTPLIALQ